LAIRERPWFVDIANFKATRVIPENFDSQQKNKLVRHVNQYVLDKPHLFKIGYDNLLRRCVPEDEVNNILWHCHIQNMKVTLIGI